MRFTTLLSLLVLLPSVTSAQGPVSSITRYSVPAPAAVHDGERIHLRNLPIVFEENRGQSRAGYTYEFELLAKPVHPLKLIERLQKQQR
jgi:hypothetical protein